VSACGSPASGRCHVFTGQCGSGVSITGNDISGASLIGVEVSGTGGLIQGNDVRSSLTAVRLAGSASGMQQAGGRRKAYADR